MQSRVKFKKTKTATKNPTIKVIKQPQIQVERFLGVPKIISDIKNQKQTLIQDINPLLYIPSFTINDTIIKLSFPDGISTIIKTNQEMQSCCLYEYASNLIQYNNIQIRKANGDLLQNAAISVKNYGICGAFKLFVVLLDD